MQVLERTPDDSKGRDAVEFARIVNEYDADLQRVAFVISHDQEITRDAVQATWEIAWRQMPDALRSAQRAWLITVVANATKRELRRSRLRRILQVRSFRETAVVPGDRPELTDLKSAYSQLASRDRQILGLRYGVGLTSEEIAPLVGLSASGVRVRTSRLLAMLRKELTDAV
jgi:RNA polymerase sigma factor (sigma-70 family)